LSVNVAAARAAIAYIVERHAVVVNLVDNHWRSLYRLDDEGATIDRFHRRCREQV
jgi:uncharacterized protein YbcC (UPF0753/DUF2309 family)